MTQPEDAVAVQNVFLIVWRLNEVGGAEQHVTELAIALALSGVRVTLLSQLPLPVSTEFEARLGADGVKVVAPLLSVVRTSLAWEFAAIPARR